jgi:phage gpG-like protein
VAKYTATSNWTTWIDVSPSMNAVAKAFGSFASEFRDRREVMSRCARKVLEGIERIMGTRGSSLGDPWPGLKDKYYLARKARKGLSTAEMYASGRLAGSIKILSVSNGSIKVGTSEKQARALQWGTNRGTPSRKFIGVDDETIRQCMAELAADNEAKFSRLATKLNGMGGPSREWSDVFGKAAT